MKKLLLIVLGFILLIVGCDEIANLNPDVTSPIVVITYPVNGAKLTCSCSEAD